MLQLDDLLRIGLKHEGIINPNALSSDERIGVSVYVIERTLYRGDTGFVYLCKNTVTDQFVIIKEFFPLGSFKHDDEYLSFKRDDDNLILEDETPTKIRIFHNLKKIYLEEGECFKKLNSERTIVSVIETLSFNNTSYVVYEYIQYPSLSNLLKNKLLRPKEAMTIFTQLVASVRNLHKRGFAHKEIKPTNIYITESNIILGDFYFTNQLNCIKVNQRNIYSNMFSAPEVSDIGITPDFRCDIYALGKILDYLMDHIGYSSSKKHESSDNFIEASKIDYLLDNCTKVDPEERIQNLDEVYELLTFKATDKSKSSNVLKICIAMLLVVIAIILFIKCDGITLMKDFKDSIINSGGGSEAIVQTTEKISFTDVADSFAFNDKKVVEWTNPNHSPVFDIRIKYQGTEIYEHMNLKLMKPVLDLDLLSLNIGAYTICVYDYITEEETEFDFLINGEVDESRAIFDFDQYSFYMNEAQTINWRENVSKTKLRIINLVNLEVLVDTTVEGSSINLDTFNLSSGEYLVTIFTFSDGLKSLSDKSYVRVNKSTELLEPVILTKHNSKLSLSDYIEWLDIGYESNVEITNIATKEVIYRTFKIGETKCLVTQLGLESGIYDFSIHYESNLQKSSVYTKRFTIIE